MNWNQWSTTILIVAASLILWAYLKVKSIYSYFEKRGIPYLKPTFLLGNAVDVAKVKECLGCGIDHVYQELREEKYGGMFLGLVPSILLIEPEYVNWVLTSKFDHFMDRPLLIDEKTNPLEAHLFFLKGNKWRYLRNKLSPAFTSGKLKSMYEEMHRCSQGLLDHFETVSDGRDTELFEPLAKYTTDVIGSTAFGIDTGSLKKEESEFRAMGKKFFEQSFKNAFLLFLRFAAPHLLIALKLRTTDKKVSDYFRSIIKKVFDYRIKTSTTRGDFIQLALQLKQKGFIEVDTTETEDDYSVAYNDKITDKFEITDDLLAAQSFVFFIAGFETTARTLHFLIYMLALHPDIQERAREEVRAAKKKHGGFNFDTSKELSFLENCINETLRLYPPVPWLVRECTKECHLPDGKTVEKGMQMIIPVFSLHRDPKYFPEPMKFNPDRFNSPPIKGTFAPFGDGPRICIGKRFALLEVKMTVAQLLDKYRLEKSPQSKLPIEFAASLTLAPSHPLCLRMSKLSSTE